MSILSRLFRFLRHGGRVVLPKEGEEPVLEVLKKGEKLMEQGDHSAALCVFTEVIQRDPRSHQAFYLRGRTKLKQARISRAVRDFSRAIAIDPTNAEYYEARASARGMGKRPAKALLDIDISIALSPDDAFFRFKKGYILAILERHDEAITELSLSLIRDPNLHLALLERGRCYLAKRDTERAYRDLSRASEMGNEEAREMLAKLFG